MASSNAFKETQGTKLRGGGGGSQPQQFYTNLILQAAELEALVKRLRSSTKVSIKT
jgi:hypothetical protein